MPPSNDDPGLMMVYVTAASRAEHARRAEATFSSYACKSEWGGMGSAARKL